MIKVAITGNIASGKSEVCRLIESAGNKILYTDNLGHELLEGNAAVIEAFKDFDIISDGKISREKLAKVVFSDEVMRQKLNSIIHPLIKEKICEFFEKNSNDNVVFVEIPLLFESGMQDLFDKIVLVYSDDKIRLKRIINRNHCSKEDAILRIKSQMPQEDKLKLVDIVIKNNGSIDDLKKQIELCL